MKYLSFLHANCHLLRCKWKRWSLISLFAQWSTIIYCVAIATVCITCQCKHFTLTPRHDPPLIHFPFYTCWWEACPGMLAYVFQTHLDWKMISFSDERTLVFFMSSISVETKVIVTRSESVVFSWNVVWIGKVCTEWICGIIYCICTRTVFSDSRKDMWQMLRHSREWPATDWQYQSPAEIPCSQVAEWLGNWASNHKVAGSIPCRA